MILINGHSLLHLDVSYNRLNSLPDTLRVLKVLQVLNLSENRLNSIPAFLATLASLKQFIVAGNPVRGIPKEIITSGNQDLIVYLKEVMKGVKTIYRSKLMIVGQENVCYSFSSDYFYFYYYMQANNI